MTFFKKGNVGRGNDFFFAKSDWRGQFPFCRKNWAGEVMTFFERGNGGMGDDFLQNRIGRTNAFSAENIFVVFLS